VISLRVTIEPFDDGDDKKPPSQHHLSQPASDPLATLENDLSWWGPALACLKPPPPDDETSSEAAAE
jgi:hypothetical protein